MEGGELIRTYRTVGDPEQGKEHVVVPLRHQLTDHRLGVLHGQFETPEMGIQWHTA